MAAGRKSDGPEPEAKPFHNPFGALAPLRDQLPEGAPPPASSKPAPKVPARAVVGLERKGRGGKEVTFLSHLELQVRELEVWLKSLKNELGCGGSLEGDVIILQGDQRERLRALLAARGISRISVS